MRRVRGATRWKAITMLAVGLLVTAMSSPLAAQTIDELKAGVVKIRSEYRESRKTGTGFIVSLTADAAYVVTASHVIVGGDSAPKVEFFTRRNVFVPAEVIGLESGDRGLALLLVKGKSNLPPGLLALPLARSPHVADGTEATVIGFPRMAGPWSVIRVQVISQTGQHLIFSGPIEEGNSGGAILAKGSVGGVVTELGSPYGGAVPAAVVRLFVEGLGVNPSTMLANARIAFVSNRDGNREIYVMNSDGTNLTRLTHDRADDDCPAWAPDGRRIVFQSERGGSEQLFVMNAEGGKPVQITHPPGTAGSPAWSPDGERIVFVARRNDADEITVVNSDGKERKVLRSLQAGLGSPSWSPDGTRIAYHAYGEGSERVAGQWMVVRVPAIYVMNSDGTNDDLLSRSPTYDTSPSWAPNGTALLFESLRDDRTHGLRIEFNPTGLPGSGEFDDFNIEIYTMNADGFNATRLTNNRARDYTPAWSPDGERIAFASNRDWNRDGRTTSEEGDRAEIYLMNADGTMPVRLTNTRAQNIRPAWSPFPR